MKSGCPAGGLPRSHPGGPDMTERLITLAAFRPPGRGLELGAGAGKATEYLKKQGFRMTALDLEPAGPEVEEGDMRSLLLPEECFDFCLAECSVSVCGDGDAALKEAYRVLKKGGVFLLSDVFFRQENAPALSMKRPLTLACWQEAFTEAGFRQEAFRDETAAWKEFFLECLWNGSASPESQEFFREAGRAGCGYFLTCLRKGGRRDGYI